MTQEYVSKLMDADYQLIIGDLNRGRLTIEDLIK
jgi:hypothetical protein